MNVIKSNFNLHARAGELCIEINEVEGCGTKNFPFWSRNGLSCKKIYLSKVNFLLKPFKTIFDMDQNWTRLRSVIEVHNPGSWQLESCPLFE